MPTTPETIYYIEQKAELDTHAQPQVKKKTKPAMAATEGGDGAEVRLIGAWPSPFVMRPRIALNLKGVEYEFVQESLGSKSELLLRSNPVHKKIPVMLHRGRPVSESLNIVQYIDDVWPAPAPILPSDPYHRALHRFWAAYIDDKWFPALSGIARSQTEEGRKECIGQVQEGLELLEGAFAECSRGKPFFSGDAVGFLDIALGCFLGWLRVAERANAVELLGPAATPRLDAWADRFCADEAVRPVMPDTDRLAEFAKVLQAKFRAAATSAAPPAK